MTTLVLRTAILALAIGAATTVTSEIAIAQSSEDLVRALSKEPTRSLSPIADENTARIQSLVKSLQGKATRQITVEERTEIAKVARESALPQADLEIYFDYDSAAITEAALPTLGSLGQALSSSELRGAIFLIAGHTDARGSAEYNQGLSERRAEAVRSFLTRTFEVGPETLIALGYGEEQLRLPNDRLSAENRRVQIVNLTVANSPHTLIEQSQ